MNIFILDYDIELNAKYHCNTHVCKMPTEYMQILSTVLDMFGLDAPMKPIRVCNLVEWVAESKSNFVYLMDLCEAVCDEYSFRYGNGKVHSVYSMLLDVSVPDMEDIGLTPFVYSKGMKEFYCEDIVDHYRNYYKSKLTQGGWRWGYKNRELPKWHRTTSLPFF